MARNQLFWMKRSILYLSALLMFLCEISPVGAQGKSERYWEMQLTDGTVYRGTLLEREDESVAFRTRDGRFLIVDCGRIVGLYPTTADGKRTGGFTYSRWGTTANKAVVLDFNVGYGLKIGTGGTSWASVRLLVGA